MNDVQAKIIVALIGLTGTVIGLIVNNISKSKKLAIEEAIREQNQTNLFNSIMKEMKEIKLRLDKHNHYAQKFGEIEKSIVRIDTILSSNKKGK